MWPLRPKPATYPTEVREFDVSGYGRVQYAQWLHPKETSKEISAEQVAFWRQFVKPGDVALDIGAHTGDTTLPLALATGPAGLVIALERNPHVFKVLRQNVDLNGPELVNITPYNFAATEEDGEFVFHYSDAGFCNGGFLSNLKNRRHGHRHALHVEGKNLSSFLRRQHANALKRMTFVKIDTEGYDRTVIESLADLLVEYRPVVMTELYKRLTEVERLEFAATIRRIGYRVRLASAAEDDWLEPTDLLQINHTDLVAVPLPNEDRH